MINELLREIQAEKERILVTLHTLENTLKRKEITIVELAAIATFLHNTYNGIENILKRILKYKGISLFMSDSWHRDILDLSVKHKIISYEFSKRLDEYRAFRHFFVHGYGIMLDKEKLIPLAENLPSLWQDFETELQGFLSRAGGKNGKNK